jgi:hypothetical protein
MKKIIICLLIGIVCGYFYGFSDAKSHRKNVVSRVVARVGGSTRGKYGNDIDRRMDAAER